MERGVIPCEEDATPAYAIHAWMYAATVETVQERKNPVKVIAISGRCAFLTRRRNRNTSQHPGTHGNITESAKRGTGS